MNSPEQSKNLSSQETQPKPIPTQELVGQIKMKANYEGNWWLAQLARLQDPTIRKQLVDLWESNEKYLQENGVKEYKGLGDVMKDPVTGQIIWLDEDLGLAKYDSVYETIPHSAMTRKDLEDKIQKAIDYEASVTMVDFEKGRSDSVNTPIGFDENNKEAFRNITDMTKRTALIGMKEDELFLNDEGLTKKMSLAESHEKGHTLRSLQRSPYLDSLFSSAFDLPPGSMYLDTQNPSELIERMAQLKNYFGMKGSEKFTPQHLEYAREHYLEDVGFDNQMSDFFRAVTPEKEFHFLKLINSIGI